MAIATAMMILDKDEMIFHAIFATMVHELGHICAMVLKGYKPYEIECRAFDIKIVDAKRSNTSYKDDVIILLMGAIFNFIYGFLNLVMYKTTGLDIFLKPMYENFFLGIFNFLPIESLDGGQILHSLLCRRLEIKTAGDITCMVSFVFLFPIAAVGFYILIISRYNFSLLLISCYLIAVIVLKRCNFANHKKRY